MVMAVRRSGFGQLVSDADSYIREAAKKLDANNYRGAANSYAQGVAAIKTLQDKGANPSVYRTLIANSKTVGTALLRYGMGNVQNVVNKWNGMWDNYMKKAELAQSTQSSKSDNPSTADRLRSKAANDFLETTVAASKPFILSVAREADEITRRVATIVNAQQPNDYASRVANGADPDLKKLAEIRETLEMNAGKRRSAA
ncbi:MAG: hypothetical protein HY516_03405 [Candidatus Aenigmarchaeota archaeon]|nr:hypothetical protein [Candidatus Aenigmarchaeota archaeon]